MCIRDRHNIDAKGRLIVPSKFREELGEKFVVTRGMDGCLFGYPLNEWSQLEAKLQEMPLAKKDARTFVRFFYSAATAVSYTHLRDCWRERCANTSISRRQRCFRKNQSKCSQLFRRTFSKLVNSVTIEIERRHL